MKITPQSPVKASGRRSSLPILVFFSTMLVCLQFHQIAFSQQNVLTVKQSEILRYRLANEKTDTGKFRILIKLATYQVSKPGELKTDLDSALYYINEAGRLSARMHTAESAGAYYLISSCYYNESGKNDLSREALIKATSFAKAGKDKALLGAVYQESANRLELSQSALPEKIRLLQLAVDAYSMTENKRKLGDCLRLLADVRMTFKIDYKALPELDSAKRLYQEARSGDWQQLYILYSRYYSTEGNNAKALDAILNAIRMTSVTDSTMEACELNNYASISFRKMGEYQNAVEYGKKALAIANKHHSGADAYTIIWNITFAYSKLQMSGAALHDLRALEKLYPVLSLNPTDRETDYECNLRIYNDLKQYDQARKYYDILKDIIDRKILTDDYPVNAALAEMIRYCIGNKQYQAAAVLLKHKKELTQKLGQNPAMLRQDFNFQITLDTTLKNFRSSTANLIKLKSINDSLFSDAQVKQQKEMEVEYATELKDNENNLQKQKKLNLTGQQNLQRAELRTAMATRNIILLSAAGIIIITLLIYLQYVKSKKTNIVIAEKNTRLEQLLIENEWLLKEVNHRVKNNLQIVISLLNSQSAYLEEGAALDAILKSKGRVESIALIHQKLYKSDSQSSIYMPEYINELVAYLKDSFTDDHKVWFEVSIDDIQLDVADTVPIGLIINESVTNAIKHAFKIKAPDSDPEIIIALKKMGMDLELTIRDNGSGYIPKKSNENSSFGLLLVNGLSKDLGGKLAIYNDGGTVVKLSFSPSLLTDNASPKESSAKSV